METWEEGGRRNYWGNEPDTEEEFHASQGIRGSQTIFTSPSTGRLLFTRSWLSSTPSPPRGLVLMVHGYGNDISWTFQSTPIFLARHGFACFALDLPGHGRSNGLKAFVPDLDSVIDDCISYFSSILTSHRQQQQQPCFLYGESMGGAICLLIHLRSNALQGSIRGAVLVAPMCKISESIRPRWPLPQILTLAARFFPSLPIVPTANLIDKSVRVEEKRIIAASNPMRYNGKPRLGTVLELVRVTDHLGTRLFDVTIPFIVLHGGADAVTDPEVSRELYKRSKSEDKTIKMYDGMMHSLLFGETDSNVDLVRKDILAWLDARCCCADRIPSNYTTSTVDNEF
nr:caffeoyl shikimate esterase 4 [Leucojum aestivum]